VVQNGKRTTAIEVKSGRVRENIPGMDLFHTRHRSTRKLLVGEGGISIKDFLLTPGKEW